MLYRDYRLRETYLAPIDDKTLQMIGDSRVRASCERAGCLFFVQNRMCVRKMRGRCIRYCIFEVRGETRAAINRFDRLMETYFPEYKLRKHYDQPNIKARLAFNEWTPDNTKLYFMSQRFGLGRGNLSEISLEGPCGGVQDFGHGQQVEEQINHQSGLLEMVEEIPRSFWMTGDREKKGLYTTSFGNCVNFQPLLFRRASKNKTYKGRKECIETTKPLVNMNYFRDPEYLERLIDPMREDTQRQREAMLEAERHSNKTVIPGSRNEDEAPDRQQEKKK